MELGIQIAWILDILKNADRDRRQAVDCQIGARQAQAVRIHQKTVHARQAVLVHARRMRQVFPVYPIQGRRAVIGVVAAVLRQPRHDGKRRRNRSQITVGPHQTHGER